MSTWRSQRVHLVMPVRVYGHGPDEEPFLEETCTLALTADGGLVKLATPVRLAQTLILTNLKTCEDVVCRVAFFGPAQGGTAQVGIEFINPARRFWPVTFLPNGWNPAERKRPQPHRLRTIPSQPVTPWRASFQPNHVNGSVPEGVLQPF